MRNISLPVGLAIALVLWLRLLLGWQATVQGSAILFFGLVLGPGLLLILAILSYSPPIGVLVIFFIQPLLAEFSRPSMMGGSTLPVISLFAICSLFLLITRRIASRNIRFLVTPVFGETICAIGLYLAIGIGNAWYSGALATTDTMIYTLDYIRNWLGVLCLVILACRNLDDVRTFILAYPFAFLIYPVSLPLATWQNFFYSLVSSKDIFSAGLMYGSLNTNTLGQAASLAALIAAAVFHMCRPSRLRSWLIFAFLINTAIMLMTGSKQSVLSLLLGLLTLAILSRWRQGFVLFVSTAIAALLILFATGTFLSLQSGLLSRYLEIVTPMKSWSTGSGTVRLVDFYQTTELWLRGNLMFGRGFVTRVSHNIFLGMIVEVGGAGLILFVALWTRSVHLFLRHIKRSPAIADARLIRTVVLPALTCILFQQSVSGGNSGGIWTNAILGLMITVIAIGQIHYRTRMCLTDRH